MRIAITTDPGIPVPPYQYGGIERIIDFLVKGLIKRGHQVVLVAHKDSSVKADIIPYKNNNHGFLDHFNNLITISKLKSFSPEVIHSFSRLAYLLPFLKSPVQKLMSYQREPTLSQIKKASFLAKNNTLSFTGCSNYITDKIRQHCLSFTIYNGVETEKYTPKFEISDNAPLVFLGRIEPIKGTHLAIEIAKKTKKKLIIAGNIPNKYQDYYSSQVAPHLGPDISYVGPVNDEEKNIILSNGAALLMPILWDEPFGIVMAEAMACGTPVIGLNRGSVPEIVKNGINGYVCNTIREMAEKIANISTIRRETVRHYCKTNFDHDVIVEQYLELYNKLINRPLD